ncbi:MAG TPA: hypothetical protein VII78_08735 [Myxococcota bacterium]|jgi:hypothetical protein
MSERRHDDLDLELTDLSRALDEFRVGAPPRALLDTTLARAKRELREQVALRRLPVGFRRELLKIAIAAAPPLALVIAWNAFLLPRLAGVLDQLMPTPIANGLAFGYAGCALVWLTLAAGCLPIAANQRARARAREA